MLQVPQEKLGVVRKDCVRLHLWCKEPRQLEAGRKPWRNVCEKCTTSWTQFWGQARRRKQGSVLRKYIKNVPKNRPSRGPQNGPPKIVFVLVCCQFSCAAVVLESSIC